MKEVIEFLDQGRLMIPIITRFKGPSWILPQWNPCKLRVAISAPWLILQAPIRRIVRKAELAGDVLPTKTLSRATLVTCLQLRLPPRRAGDLSGSVLRIIGFQSGIMPVRLAR